ncbi:MAG: hypothetical protein H7836_12395 [Magnetococcus sp. YQC-3]
MRYIKFGNNSTNLIIKLNNLSNFINSAISPLKKIKNNIVNLIKILNSIEEIKTNDSKELYIKFKSNLIIETNGSQLFYTKEGMTIVQSKLIHLNPKSNN